MTNKEVDGDLLASAALVQREMLALANALFIWQGRWENGLGDEASLVSVRIKFPGIVGGDILFVVQATVEGHAVVGFHSDSSLTNGLKGFAHRLRQGSIKWRTDEYRSGS